MSEVTIHCTHCGDSIPSSLQFCPNCGAPAPETIPSAPRETSPGGSVGASSAPEEGDVPDWAREPDPDPEPEPDLEPEPEISPPGLILDWEPELLELLEEAAQLEGVTVDRFVRQLVEPAVLRTLRSKKGLLTLNQAANLLGVTRREVIQMINTGRLRARKVENEWKVEQKSIDRGVEEAASREDQIELDLRQLVDTSGLMGLNLDGDVSDSVSATLCYVNQEGVLIAPRAAWRKLGRKRVLAEAKDAVRRYIRRRDRELGRI